MFKGFSGSLFIFTFLSLLFCIPLVNAADEVPTVLVSIAPHRAFVKAIAGDTVNVAVVVPPGASPHTFEPTPKQMMQVGKADIWFRVGESFEPRLADVIKSYHPNMLMVNLREGLNLIRIDPHNGNGARCCHNDFEDIHFWLSAREAKGQAQHIAAVLSEKYPANAPFYTKNLKVFVNELDALDKEITEMMKDKKGMVIMVSHPSYAYFARDYGLEQVSIEFEGKDPTAQQLIRILALGREQKVKKIFTQPQYRGKGADLVGRQLNAKVVVLDPYSENYLNNMRTIAHQFSTAEQEL